MSMTIDKAAKLIEGVLSELEKDTGQFVIDININDIEVTRVADERPQIHRHVQIELHRLPGTNWGK